MHPAVDVESDAAMRGIICCRYELLLEWLSKWFLFRLECIIDISMNKECRKAAAIGKLQQFTCMRSMYLLYG